MPHRLSDKDPDARLATCSVCGPGAKIRPVGNAWQCMTASRQSTARYKQAHPDRAAAGRGFKPSKHRLQVRKGGADTCAICGPVESVAIGWGYMCPTRATELNWKNLPAAPVPLCPTCKSRHLDGTGACPECDAPLTDYDRRRPGKYIDTEDSTYAWSDFETEALEAGLSIIDEDPKLPNEVEKVVYGWKTIGSNRPITEHTVRPEYAALYGGNK